jgi:hypothetical protein
MRFMNDWDIEMAQREHADHPVLSAATKTLRNLADWADQNSDGWAFWPKPMKAAEKLIVLIQGDAARRAGERNDPTPQEYREALRPIKAFRTRHQATFEIIEV